MKEVRSGGHEQGILMGTPWALGMPSQSPVPVGFRPAARPNSGTKAGFTLDAAGAEAGAGAGAGAAGALCPFWMA
jgi:hypothetical protein